MNTSTDYNQQAVNFLLSTSTAIHFKYDGFKKYFDEDKQKRNVFIWTLTRGSVSISGKFGSSIIDSCKETPILQSSEPIEIYAGISTTDPNVSIHKTSKSNRIYLSSKIKTNCNVLRNIKDNKVTAESILPLTNMEQSYSEFITHYKKAKKKPTGIGSSFDSFKNYVIKRINEKINELESETVLLDQAEQVIEPSAYDLLSCLTKYDPGTFENFCSDYGYDPDSRKAEKTYRSVLEEWNNVSNLFTEYEIEQLQEIQ